MIMERRIDAVIYILITFAFVNEILINVYAWDGNRRRPKEKSGGFQNNICDSTDRVSKIHCYCENNVEPKTATKAECWVFDKDIPHDNIIWQSFATQPILKSLSFSIRANADLGYIPTKALFDLQRLSTFNIRYGNIVNVTPFALANLTNLKEANLSLNQIENLQRHSFANLPNLTTLILEKNLIIEIDAEALCDLPKLQKLVFTNNNISTIRNGTFQHTYNLLELDLNENKIYCLNVRMFDGLANLRKLDLRQNRIQNLTDFTFVELWNLEELLLGKNDLQYISTRAFDGMSRLQKLSLDDNKLSSLPLTLLEGVRGLSSLDVRSNELHALTFDHIKPILDNLKPENSSLLLEVNNFVCDCKLKWMHSLRNETKSENTKASLDGVTCKMDSPIMSSAYNKIPDAKDNKVDYNSDILHAGLTIETLNDKINGTEKKTIPGDPSKDDGSKISHEDVKRTVLKIPADTLPCPREAIKTAPTAGYGPIKNKMKVYKNQMNSGYMNLRASFGFQVMWSICFRFFYI